MKETLLLVRELSRHRRGTVPCQLWKREEVALFDDWCIHPFYRLRSTPRQVPR